MMDFIFQNISLARYRLKIMHHSLM